MKDLFEAIEFLFVNVLFLPLDLLRKLELTSWVGANIINWIFVIICSYYMIYWLREINKHKANNEDNQDTTAHSFLK